VLLQVDVAVHAASRSNGFGLPHLRELKPAFPSSYSVTLNGSVHLAATVCVCAHVPIDFAADTSAVEETSGELELF
jgi:hypothetical protein